MTVQGKKRKYKAVARGAESTEGAKTTAPAEEAKSSFSPLQAAATATRYGPPIAAGMTGLGIPAMGGIAAGSEFAAQKIEEYEETGEVNWTDFNANLTDIGESALAGLGDMVGAKYLGPAGKYFHNKIKNTPLSILKKMFVPAEKSFTAEGAIAGEVLEKLGGRASAVVLTGGKGSEAFFEDMFRAAIFSSGKWGKFDVMNEKLVLDAFEGYVNQISKSIPPSMWGEKLTKMMIGTGKEWAIGSPKGELGYARAMRNTFYEAFRETADAEGDRFMAKGMEEFLAKEGNRTEVKAVMAEIGGLLSQTVKQADASIEAELANMPKSLATLVRKSLGDDPTLGTMSPGDAVELRKLLNGIKKDPSQPAGVKGVANKLLSDYVLPGIDDAIADNPIAKKALAVADKFYQTSADRLETDITKKLYRQMKAAPDAIFSYAGKAGTSVTGTIGPGKDGIAILNQLEAAFTAGSNTTLTRGMYDMAVLKPIQTAYFRQAADAGGKLQGKKIVELFAEGNEWVEKVYGREAVTAIRKLGITLKLMQNIPKSGSVLMQLTQGGTLIQGVKQVPKSLAGPAMGAGAGFVAGGAAGAATAATVVLLSPVVITRWLTNPKTLKMITEGVTAGPTSAKFHKMMGIITGLNAAERVEMQDLANLGDRAMDFYTRPFEPEALMQAPPDGAGFPQRFQPGQVM